ncbi:MAG: hypothetical protein WC655_01590 [Candidatus Hydrogenedentales bacterium]|jgi:hypothetical protein
MRIVTLAMLLVGICAYAWAVDVPLRFQQYSDGSANAMPWSATRVPFAKQPPSGDLKLPKLKSKTPAYALLKLGEAEFLIVLDSRSSSDSFYNRLHFDANGNHDLTDDPEVSVEASYSWWDAYANIRTTPPLTVSLPANGQSAPYSFMIQAYCSFTGFSASLSRKENWERLTVLIVPSCLLTGEFDLGGEHYRFSLCDQDGNGKFDDVASVQEDRNRDPYSTKGDVIYISTGRQVEYDDALGMSDKLFVQDTLYDVRIDRIANMMTLTPVIQGLGTLTLPQGLQRLVLARADGKSSIAYLNPGQTVTAPAGDYRLHSYEIIREDKSGNLWRLMAQSTGNETVTKVAENSQTALKAGEPLRPTMKLAYYSAPGLLGWSGGAQFSFLLKGAGGEEVTSLLSAGKISLSFADAAKWSNRSKEPTYKIMTDDGEIVAQGQFEYG